ncbi:hypothetical protein [Planococcus salinus]|uniref:hypothetical protein n=1 Tax=Planococcus salinus TaxID=1848460 RepID=UPI0011CDC069|nr:hypothetical protein [Planococcus salinus]
MFNKLKTIASLSILTGVLLLIANADETFNLYKVPYILIIAGFVLLIISLLVTNHEKHLLCRIGLHRFVQVDRDSEVPALFVYQCERCGKEKKAMKSF